MTTMTLNLRRFSFAEGSVREALADLRSRLSPRGDVVTPQSRERTLKVFGQPLTPQQAVARICDDVRTDGLSALLSYTRKFDGVELAPQQLRVPHDELLEARADIDADLLATVTRVRDSLLAFQTGLLHRDAVLRMGRLYELRQRYRPLARVGICIPGGAAAYLSTALMTVVPAQAAGVPQIAVVVPPTKFGGFNRDLLAVLGELGVREVYRVGGAQAVAALAYGVDGIEPVEKIVGPGNLYVQLAKREVFGQVGIDFFAGPSEIVVLADGTANPQFVAADLIAQAEHAPGAAILLTWSERLLDEVGDALAAQLEAFDRGAAARESLEQFGALVLTRTLREAVDLTNFLAPEHLHLQVADPEWTLSQIDSAGAIFLGPYSPVAIGDYVAGPSHVLPTGSTARFTGGLSANDFLKRSSVIYFSPDGLKQVADDVCLLAEREKLPGHRRSIEVRLEALAKSTNPQP